MKESRTYQMILEESQKEGTLLFAHAVLLRLGKKRSETPLAETQAILEALTRVDALERLTHGVLETESWTELLATQ